MDSPLSEADREAIEAAIFAGRKIEAIKLYREATGQGLKEAKDFVEAWEAELRKSDPQRFSKPAGGGCGTAVLLLAVAFAVVAAWLG